MSRIDFDRYSEEVEKATDEIDLKKAISTSRKGKAKFIDNFVLGKYSWQEALTYMAIIQSIVIFMALIPDSVQTINNFLTWLHIPIQFPVEIASVTAVTFIVFVFIFGIIAVRVFGTTRRTAEIGTKLGPNSYLLWKKITSIEEKLEKLEEKKK